VPDEKNSNPNSAACNTCLGHAEMGAVMLGHHDSMGAIHEGVYVGATIFLHHIL
jgi:hypothetical protein